MGSNNVVIIVWDKSLRELQADSELSAPFATSCRLMLVDSGGAAPFKGDC